MPSLHDFQARAIDGKDRALADYKGQVAVVVNVASRCGLTPQYEGLQKLYADYAGRGLTVLGFPCNQFAGQEPGTEEEIQSFCDTRFGVTFPLFAKVDVNGAARHPLYAWLTAESTAPDGAGDVAWNFAKFVVGRDGKIVARFAPPTKPDDPALVAAVEKALG